MNARVDAFLNRQKKWQDETRRLRDICLACGLTEELKWGKPCYTFNGSNVVIIQGFKDFCALLFCKGALLKSRGDLLKKPGDNTQAARRIEFTNAEQIDELSPKIKSCIGEAIAAEKAGLQVEFKKNPEPIPAELQTKMIDDRKFKSAFTGLTPGRQRAYILYFSAAKQSTTRHARIEKCTPRILAGKGLND